MNKVIISCAITGSIHTPSMSPYLPQTPADIAESAVGAAHAGAAILHLHARDPLTGRPTPSADTYMEFLPRIHAETDAVINITTGGASGMTLDERLEAAERVSPELASLNMGTLCFGLFLLAARQLVDAELLDTDFLSAPLAAEAPHWPVGSRSGCRLDDLHRASVGECTGAGAQRNECVTAKSATDLASSVTSEGQGRCSEKCSDSVAADQGAIREYQN